MGVMVSYGSLILNETFEGASIIFTPLCDPKLILWIPLQTTHCHLHHNHIASFDVEWISWAAMVWASDDWRETIFFVWFVGALLKTRWESFLLRLQMNRAKMNQIWGKTGDSAVTDLRSQIVISNIHQNGTCEWLMKLRLRWSEVLYWRVPWHCVTGFWASFPLIISWFGFMVSWFTNFHDNLKFGMSSEHFYHFCDLCNVGSIIWHISIQQWFGCSL